jgi:hypothetical protein
LENFKERLKMQLLINDKEISYFLLGLMNHYDAYKNLAIEETETEETIAWILEKRDGPGKFNLDKWRIKFKDRLAKAVSVDLSRHIDMINHRMSKSKKSNLATINQNIEKVILALGEETILELYRKNKQQNFVKSVGFHLDVDATMVRRKNYTDIDKNCLIRNTVGNEELLISKIDNSYPFWFIDSGYTNFLEPNKKWHRLVANHLHHSKYIDVPSDRLGMFKTFPKPWREGGDKILIVEPGPLAAGIFHVDTKTWRYDVERELRQYTDKQIVFREKINKKTRTNLHQHLLDEDYFCTISINSNSATESIWAGVPAITLDKHISNPVTRNKLSDINNLYRGNIANWLAMLSYSQFTYDELIEGTAIRILKTYYV